MNLNNDPKLRIWEILAQTAIIVQYFMLEEANFFLDDEDEPCNVIFSSLN